MLPFFDKYGLSIIALILVGASIFFLLHIKVETETNPSTDTPITTDEKPASEQPDTEDPFVLGQYYFNHGDKADGTYDLVKARQYFNQAVTEDPKSHLLAWHQLGRIDFLEGKFEAALFNFHKQIEHFSDQLPNVYYMLALTYGYQARMEEIDSAWGKAESNFRKYLTYDPQSPWARVDLAWVLFAQGKYQEMKDPLEVGLLHHPDNPWLLNMYGLALLNTGEIAKAKQYFNWALSEADQLTEAEWGKSYPGNDPAIWGRGLEEFRGIIRSNIELTNR